MSKYLVIGKVPPPLGGVTVFIERFVNKLVRNGDKVVLVSPTKVYRVLVNSFRAEFIHIHTISIVYLALFYVLRLLPKVTVYDHNHSRHFNNMPTIKLRLIMFFLSNIDRVFVANTLLTSNYNNCTTKVFEFSPFLPPLVEKKQSIIDSYPNAIKELIISSKPLVFTSAWKNVHEGTESVYGLDAFIKVAKAANEEGLGLSFLIMLGIESEKDEYLLKKASLVPNLTVLIGQYESWPILENAACLIRNTSTDGDSVSVREAIYFSTPVLASDRAPRPKEVKVFQKDDHQQIYKLLKDLIKG